MSDKFEIAVYHWSNWHPWSVNDEKRGKGWTEWEYLKQAVPRFQGHHQPKKPLWGYQDDSKPEVMENQINTAADHGITTFIFDWHYQGNTAALETYLTCPSRERLKFCLMDCDRPLPKEQAEEKFRFMIEHYFKQPNYLKVDGACYYSIYEAGRYANDLGGIEQLRDYYAPLHQMAAQAGLKVHFVAVEWGLQEFCCKKLDAQALVKALNFDAVTSYVWAHNTVPAWPCGDYAPWAEQAYDKMLELENKYGLPYYTHVSVGWDPSPRCPATMRYEDGGPLMYHTLNGTYEILHQPYFSSIVKNNTPAEFRRALLAAKRHLQDTDPKHKIVTLYAWNEWTEGGYLEPDSENGYGYLEAIKDVFGN